MNNRSVTEKPMEIFKILYMVIASLALTCGLERFWLNDERQLILPSDWQSWILFIIFVTTVVRFAHGAMKYLDRMLDDETTVIRLWPIFEGFGVLAIEALFFFLLAFSLNKAIVFINMYLLLLTIETTWLLRGFVWRFLARFFKNEPKAAVHKWLASSKRIRLRSFPNIFNKIANILHDRPDKFREHWAIANAFVIVPTGIPWLVYQVYDFVVCPLWIFSIFAFGVFLHTAVDYPWNKSFYFG